VHEHIASVMYYFSVHLLYASIVGAAAWVLTSIRGASGTTKYWIWVVTAFNFTVPIGAMIDKLWAPHLTWAAPLGAIGGPAWSMTQGWTAVALAVIWITGAFAMFLRLISRIRREREAQASVDLSDPYLPEREWHSTANFPAMSPSSSARMERNWFLRSQNLQPPNRRCLCKRQLHHI
jgi:hypothetical protein